MSEKRVEFANTSGDRLTARLDLPTGREPAAFVLFAHCFTCSKNLKAVRHISRALCAEGFGVLRFDFTGLGESEGDFADSNFSSNVEDLLCAAEYLRGGYESPKVLVGHSLGGAAVLQAAAKIDSVAAVATIGAPFEPTHVAHLFASARGDIDRRGEAEVVLAGRRFTIKKQFLDDLEKHNMRATIGNLRLALLILHSPVDEIVPIDNAQHIFESARHPKSFVSLDRADHLLTNVTDSRYVGKVVAAWAGKYLPVASTGERTAPATEGNTVVARTGRDGYRTEIGVRHHQMLADEPPSVGGGDEGPTPYDYLLASLGACTSMTLRMYADRKAWPLEDVIVRLQHEKIHATDCEKCESDTGRIDRIDREITLQGALDDEQRARLMEIADRCPVHRTLHAEVVVDTRESRRA